jgi:hypothetical protein
VVNYRDHPPQDNTYVTKTNPFSSDIPKVQEYLRGLMGELTCNVRRTQADSQLLEEETVLKP